MRPDKKRESAETRILPLSLPAVRGGCLPGHRVALRAPRAFEFPTVRSSFFRGLMWYRFASTARAPPNALPSLAAGGRAGPGHGGAIAARRPLRDAATPGDTRADPRTPPAPARPGRARRGRRPGRRAGKLESWEPGSPRRAAGSQVSRFPARRLARAPGDRPCGVAPR